MSDQTIDRDTARWFKSTRSNGGGGNCVEGSRLNDDGMAVRDSKDPSGPILFFAREDWSAFIDGVRQGEFDL